MPKTIAEKIFTRHAGKDVSAGDIALCDVDFCFGQDGTSTLVIDSFRALGAEKVFDKAKFAMVIDHSAPSPSIDISKVHQKMRGFAKEQDVKIFDVGCGVCHEIIPEQTDITCGDLVTGADSHTCTYGAVNIFSTGMGSTDVAIVAATGKNWFRVPESMRIIINGELAPGVYAKDVILHIIGEIGAAGATYMAIEFSGEVIDGFSIESRMTISNMAVELGAKAGLMKADRKTLEWIWAHSKRKPQQESADKGAKYFKTYGFNISTLEPQIACPHTVDNVKGVSEVAGTPVQVAYIGTCTNGRLEDLRVAAQILEGKKVNNNVKLIVAPASQEIYLEAVKEGIIDKIVSAGAVCMAAGCGPCVGTHNGVLADGENAISTANRNFKGRMGNPEGFIYLGSPATVATSAIEGAIVDPRKYM